MRNQKNIADNVRVLCLLLCSILVLVLSGCSSADKALVLTSREAPAEEIPGNLPEETEETQPTEQEAVLFVHVCGAVQSPGVVELAAGSRVSDALEAAGGFTREAHEEYVNLASRLEDGQQLYFPTREEAAELEQQKALNGLVDINTAGPEQLCTLPGIGESRAQAILDFREQQGPFQSPEDIMKVPGIKESAYEKLKDKIVVN